MIKNVFGLFMLAALGGCATYSEPGYTSSAAVLRRVSRLNAETRRNIQIGAVIIGAGIGIASILRED